MRYHQHFVRCGHCGLAHDVGVQVCPTTGLVVGHHLSSSGPKRRRRKSDKARRIAATKRVGTCVGDRYRVRSLIGEGGMSSVFDAEDLQTHRSVALKVLHESALDEPRALDLLRHEAGVIAAIGHPNICPVYDLGTTGEGCPYLVMERLVGETLAARLASSRPMHLRELLAILQDVLTALAATHARGVIHRDLKPHNVFLARRDDETLFDCKLLDLGLATWISAAGPPGAASGIVPGWVAGTPYYMAPEQARGDGSLDQRVDLWSVAVMAYEALAGRRPFVAANYHALMVKILTSHPRALTKLRPDVPDAVAAVIERGLSKAREDRFQTAADFLEALSPIAEQLEVDEVQCPTLVLRRESLHREVRDDEEVTVVARPARRPRSLDGTRRTASLSSDEEDTATTLVIQRPQRR